MGNTCVLAPEINGEYSAMYLELSKKIKDRPLTNLIYASYLQQGVAAQMDAAGYKRNSQGQHKADDIYDFFRVNDKLSQIDKINSAKRRLGATDSSGNTLAIADVNEAFKKAKAFNDSNEGLVATIQWDGSEFHYFVSSRDSRTNTALIEFEKTRKSWEALKSAFEAVNVDIAQLANNALTQSFFNPLYAKGLGNALQRLSQTNIKTFRDSQIASLLFLNPTDTGVIRILNLYNGNREVATQAIKEVLDGNSSLSSAKQSMITATLERIKKLPTVDLDAIVQEESNIALDTSINSKEAKIQDTLNQLAKDFGIDINEISLKSKEIRTVEQAAASSILTLKRRLKELNDNHNRSSIEENERALLQQDIKKISSDIAAHRYYESCLRFLVNAEDKMFDVSDLLKELEAVGATPQETAFMHTKTMTEIQNIIDGYYRNIKIIEGIENLESLETLTKDEKQQLQQKASEVAKILKNTLNTIAKMRKEVMIELCESILGTEMPDGTRIADLITAMDLSPNMFDRIYSFARSNNPLIAAMGTITRDAQIDRNNRIKEYRNRIRILTKKLYDSGSSSEFMYEEDGYHIISDIDWNAFYEARNKYKEQLEAQGTKGEELQKELWKWENLNKEDRVVDVSSGRTERVPNKRYRKAFPKLTPEQRAYYDAVMEIKGALETEAPRKAQSLYRPPQVKRSIGDIILNPHGITDMVTGLGRRFIDNFRFTENDYETNASAINGEEITESLGNYKGEKQKEIPIHYLNPIKNKKELSRDFSGALEAEVSTLMNYSSLSEVLDVVKYMQDYINNDILPTTYKEESESMVDKSIRIAQKLKTQGEAVGVSDLMKGFMDMQFYGEKLDEKAANSKFAKLLLSLVGYTSIKSLAVNVKGAVANELMGEIQMVIEAGGGEFYGFKDLAWAHNKFFGFGKNWKDSTVDFFLNSKSSYDYLLAEKFGFMPAEFRDMKEARYYKNPIRRLLGKFEMTGLYAIGEHWIHHLNGYAVLHGTKVLIDGKKSNLYEAFRKEGDPDNPKLVLKDNVTDLYGNPVNEEFIKQVASNILYCNESCHGGMSEEARGVLGQKLAGRAVGQFRQWMIETLARRGRGQHWDGTLHDYRTGFDVDALKWMKGLFQDMETIEAKGNIAYKNATPRQKANIRRFWTASFLVLAAGLATLGVSAYIEDNEDDSDKIKWLKFIKYQLSKIYMDLFMTDTFGVGIALNYKTYLNNLIPASKTAGQWTYPIIGAVRGDYKETVNHHGEFYNRYYLNCMKYAVPFWKEIDLMQNWGEDDAIFTVFDESAIYR